MFCQKFKFFFLGPFTRALGELSCGEWVVVVTQWWVTSSLLSVDDCPRYGNPHDGPHHPSHFLGQTNLVVADRPDRNQRTHRWSLRFATPPVKIYDCLSIFILYRVYRQTLHSSSWSLCCCCWPSSRRNSGDTGSRPAMSRYICHAADTWWGRVPQRIPKWLCPHQWILSRY